MPDDERRPRRCFRPLTFSQYRCLTHGRRGGHDFGHPREAL
jgi:hypothetical protein